MENITTANTKFGLNLFCTACHPISNAVISPLSLSVALSMTELGANGETANSMGKTLCWGVEESVIHEENRKYVTLRKKPNDLFIFSIAQRLYVEQGLPFLPDFLEKTQKLYLAEAIPAQFNTNPEEECKRINTWVSEQTHDKIKDIIEPGFVRNNTKIILVNIIYFKGMWDCPFDEEGTKLSPFKVSETETKNVPMMKSLCGSYNIWINRKMKGFSALEMPYEGGQFSMVIILPNADFGLAEIEKSLSLEQLQIMFSKLEYQNNVNLFLPKFQMTCTYELKEPLCQMGMAAAFDPSQADFSRMTKATGLCVSDVVHKAFISVTERGTEAGAATCVGMLVCTRSDEVDFVVDHPFFFLIRDKRVKNNVVFMGRVVDPSV